MVLKKVLTKTKNKTKKQKNKNKTHFVYYVNRQGTTLPTKLIHYTPCWEPQRDNKQSATTTN